MDVYLCVTGIAALIITSLVYRKRHLLPPRSRGFNYTAKWLFNFLHLKLLGKPSKSILHSYAPTDLGVLPLGWEEELEQPQSLIALTSSQAFDTVSFAGNDTSGNNILIKISKRINRKADVWLTLSLKDHGVFQLPIHPATTIHNTKDNSFTAGGLCCQMLEPLRRWRVSFSGFLRKEVRNSLEDVIPEDSVVHAKFSFIWCAITRPFDTNDEMSPDLLSHVFSVQPWSKQFSPDLKTSLKRQQENCSKHMQWGQIYGTLKFEGVNDDVSLHLRGLRERAFGKSDLNVDKFIDLQVYMNNGDAIHLELQGSMSEKNIILLRGCIFKSEGSKLSITWTDLDLYLNAENLSSVLFQAGGKTYHLEIQTTDLNYRLFSGGKLHYGIDVNVCTLALGNEKGFGFLKFGNKRQRVNEELIDNDPLPILKPKDLEIEKNDLVVNTSSDKATCSKFVGGKGSSLAMLHQFKFIVPTSICVTNAAYASHLENCHHLIDFIQHLEAVAWKRCVGDLKSECQKLVNATRETFLDSKIKEEIRKEMEKVFGIHYQSMRFAVRSSAIGEDGEELSAAGQNDTYLGVTGFDNICQAIINCWASQFTFTAIEYKRQHGQLLNPGMAVVIQEMIPAEVAGVLFTQDPSNGNPGRIFITANYGLGETVVSGVAEPDTFIIKRSFDDKLFIEEKILGSKTIQIIPSENATKNASVDLTAATSFCLSEENCLEIARIGILVEKCFGSARDIEWCILYNQIYLLQARPITSFDQPSDFEIMHEFDSPIKTDWEHCTKANAGEVFPNASTPLSISTVIKTLTLSIQNNLSKIQAQKCPPNPYVMIAQMTTYNHCVLNCIDLMCRNSGGKQTDSFRALEFSVYGHIVDHDLIYKIAGERYKETATSSLAFVYSLLKGLYKNKSIIKEMVSKNAAYKFPLEYPNALSLYSSMDDMFPCLFEITRYHLATTSAATFWNMVATITLTEGRSEWTDIVCSDIATLLANCTDVESSEVPLAMQNLAKVIAEDEEREKFYKMDVKSAHIWLQNQNKSAGKLFAEFLKNHGHRCVKEFDLYSKTWRMDPTGLVQILQNLKPKTDLKKENSSIAETIRKLETPKKPLTKKILSWILPQYRAAVGYREKSKSLVIQMVDKFRSVYHTLSQQMVNEGFLPDADLLFFLTHLEIGFLLKSRSAKLIQRAQHRKRLHSYLETLQFPEIIVGLPKPIQVEQTDLEEINSVLEISGTPVCNGVAKGTARVVVNLSDAKNIEANDILITYCTDIGWSPYFPLLSGVVTELGGLVSHGAVVAREYGLPCIVGARNATRLFKSGERVILNGSKGTLKKLTLE